MHPKQRHFHVVRAGKQISKAKVSPKFLHAASRVNNPAVRRCGMTRHTLLTHRLHLLLEVNSRFLTSGKKTAREPHLQESLHFDGQPTDFLRLVRTCSGNAAALQSVGWIHLPRGSCCFLHLLHVSFDKLQRHLLSDSRKLLC